MSKHEHENDYDRYIFNNHNIVLVPVWSFSGGRSTRLFTVIVDGEMIATRCKRDTAMRKIIALINNLSMNGGNKDAYKS